MSAAGKYKAYWEQLKRHKHLAVKVYPSGVRTLKKAIQKEKWEDDGYKFLSSEAAYRYRMHVSCRALEANEIMQDADKNKVLVEFKLFLILKGTEL